MILKIMIKYASLSKIKIANNLFSTAMIIILNKRYKIDINYKAVRY